MVIKPEDRDNRITPTANRRNFNFKHLLLFLVASILVHGLGLLIFALHRRSSVVEREPESKPIDFVIVPEESEVEPPPETQKRAVENSVTEEDTESEQIEPAEVEPEETAIAPTPPAPPPAEPEPPAAPAVPTPAPPAPPPQPEPEPQPAPPPAATLPQPELAPEPEPSTPQTSPTLSGSDVPVATQPETEPEATAPPTPEPSQPDSVATRTPPPEETAPESGSAEDLLGGNYQRSLADSGGDAFFSPEALEYESVLNPSQINALKDIDLGPYFDEMKRRVKSNWNPSYRAEDYTTYLTFDIQKNGQITGLSVTQSSGSPEVDREALEAVQNSAPFAPLPPDFPLESLGVRFSFNIYIY